MIGFVRGQVAEVSLTRALIDVGGVGLEVQCTPGTLATLRTGEIAQLAGSLVVREDSLTLFGFADAAEKELFELVQTASGVGPKVAQAMLAVLSPDTIREAIAGEDTRTLTKVPGIGAKGAQRIVLELKDKIGVLAAGTTAGEAQHTAGHTWRTQVVDGLTGLGWSAKEAEKAVDAVAEDAGPAPEVGAVLRAALQRLSKA